MSNNDERLSIDLDELFKASVPGRHFTVDSEEIQRSVEIQLNEELDPLIGLSLP